MVTYKMKITSRMKMTSKIKMTNKMKITTKIGMEFHMILNIMTMLAHTEKTTFSCKDD